jgi:hypothetical protein
MHGLRVALVFSATLLGFPSTAWTQAPRQIFGTVGHFRGGYSEGSIGNGASVGVGLTVPIAPRLIGELDVQTARVARVYRFRPGDNVYRTRRTLVIGSLLYRWPTPRGYAFAGAGVGDEVVDFSERRLINFAPRAGLVVFPASRLGIRIDAYAASWHLGLRIGATIPF